MFSQVYLFVKVVVEKSDTVMETRRLEKQTAFNFIGTLLGSIFGLLGTFDAVLAVVEGFVDKGIRCKNKRNNRNNCFERAKSIQSGFEDLKEEEEDVTFRVSNLKRLKTDSN